MASSSASSTPRLLSASSSLPDYPILGAHAASLVPVSRGRRAPPLAIWNGRRTEVTEAATAAMVYNRPLEAIKGHKSAIPNYLGNEIKFGIALEQRNSAGTCRRRLGSPLCGRYAAIQKIGI